MKNENTFIKEDLFIWPNYWPFHWTYSLETYLRTKLNN